MAGDYHRAESCGRNFALFTDRVNGWFRTNQKSPIIAQFELCIADRKKDPLFVAAQEKRVKQIKWDPADFSHYNVVLMFEGLLTEVRTIREDRLDQYSLLLEPTRKNAAKIVLSKAVVEADKIIKQKVRKGVREATDEEWAQAEEAAKKEQAAEGPAAAAPAAAGAPSAGRRRTRRKNGRRRTQKKRKTYV